VARSVTTSAATALPAEDARDGGRGRGDHHRATSDENRADHDDGLPLLTNGFCVGPASIADAEPRWRQRGNPFECKGMAPEEVFGSLELLRIVEIYRDFLAKRIMGESTSNEGRRNDRRQRVA
jgi:hypothetical protein